MIEVERWANAVQAGEDGALEQLARNLVRRPHPTWLIRALEPRQPSAVLWWELCAALDLWAEEAPELFEEAVPLLEGLLARWPDRLREAPRAWWEARVAGILDPRWGLVRRLVFHNRPGEGERLLELESLDAISPVTHLTLRFYHLGDEGAERLARAEGLQGLRCLDVGSSRGLSSQGLLALARSPQLRCLEAMDATGSRLGPELFAGLCEVEGLGWRELGLSLCHLRDDGLVALARSPWASGLRRLELRSNLITEHGLIALARSEYLGGLRHLDLQQNEIGDAGLVAVAESQTLKSLESLDFDFNPVSGAAVASLARAPSMRGLTLLSLASREIDDAAAEALAGSPWLGEVERLELWGSGLTWRGVVSLLGAPALASLSHLNVSENVVSEEPDALVLPAVGHQLRHLDLEGCGVGDVLVTALAGSPSMRALEVLLLAGNAVGDAGVKALVASPYLGQVQALSLSGNAIGDEGVEALAASSLMRAVGKKMGDLSGNVVGDRGVAALAGSVHLPRFEMLNLSDNELGPLGAEALASSPNVAGLRYLWLQKNAIGNGGLCALFESPFLDGLETLNLRYCGVTEAGLRSLAPSGLPSLRNLWLDGCRLGDAGVVALARSPWLSQVERLGLNDTGCGERGVEALAASPYTGRLRALELGDNTLGDRGVSALIDAPFFAGLEELGLRHAAISARLRALIKRSSLRSVTL